MRIILSVVASFVCLNSAPAARLDSGVSYELFVINGTNSVTRKDRENGSNLDPWYDNASSDEEGYILEIVSNNCGFAEYVYSGMSLYAFNTFFDSEYEEPPTQSIVAIGHIGEWCRLSAHLYEHQMLLVARRWNETLHIIDSTELFVDHTGNAYLIDVHFINEWQLARYVKPIPDASEQESCVRIDDMTQRVLETYENKGFARMDNYLCAANGVYLRDIPTTLKRSD